MNRVLLTGATGGIGNAILSVFLSNGYDVVTPTRSELDLSRPSTIDDYLIDWKFNILINCAGVNTPESILSTNGNNYAIAMNVNINSPHKLIQKCLPHMIQTGHGNIVNISSVLQDVAKTGRGVYSMTKAALDALTRSVAVEYGKNGILCNTVSPGYIETKLTYKNNTQEQIESIKSSLPLGRIGQPTEVANFVYWLATENSYITGQNIKIDGGYSCTGK